MDLYYLGGSQNKQFAVSIKGKAFEIANRGPSIELRPMWRRSTQEVPWLALLVTQGVSRGEVWRAYKHQRRQEEKNRKREKLLSKARSGTARQRKKAISKLRRMNDKMGRILSACQNRRHKARVRSRPNRTWLDDQC